MVRTAEAARKTLVISPPQNLTQPSLMALEHQVDQALLTRMDAVAIDLADIQSLDSAALSWLLAAQNRLAGQAIQMVLFNPSPLCRDVLLATRLEHRFKIQDHDRIEETLHA